MFSITHDAKLQNHERVAAGGAMYVRTGHRHLRHRWASLTVKYVTGTEAKIAYALELRICQLMRTSPNQPVR